MGESHSFDKKHFNLVLSHSTDSFVNLPFFNHLQMKWDTSLLILKSSTPQGRFSHPPPPMPSPELLGGTAYNSLSVISTLFFPRFNPAIFFFQVVAEMRCTGLFLHLGSQSLCLNPLALLKGCEWHPREVFL